MKEQEKNNKEWKGEKYKEIAPRENEKKENSLQKTMKEIDEGSLKQTKNKIK